MVEFLGDYDMIKSENIVTKIISAYLIIYNFI